MGDDFTTGRKKAVGPLVAALDVGSTGTRGCLYDARGLPVKGTPVKVEHAFTTGSDGSSTIDPDQVVRELADCLDHVCENAPGAIAGVALDTFASSLVGVDAAGKALTPCFTYADSRPAPQVDQLRGRLDEAAVQQRTGARQHTSYLPARFLWLAQTDATTFDAVDRWMGLGEYAWQCLLGTTAAGTSTAAWTGMFDRRTGTWDEPLCDLVGVSPGKLSPIADPDKPLRATQGSIGATRWKPLAEAAWFAPITDGFAASLGVGARDASQFVLSTATSGAIRALVTDVDQVPSGLWCYRVDQTRSILGGALNDVGRAVTWLGQTLQLPDPAQVEAALRAEPDERTPLVLPWFSGERSTGWDGAARAVFRGVSAGTTPLDLYRGTVEGVALAFRRILDEVVGVAGVPREVLTSGRVQQADPAVLVVLADALGQDLVPVTIDRSTMRGAALSALEVLAPAQQRADPTRGETVHPVGSHAAHYAERLARFEATHAAVADPA